VLDTLTNDNFARVTFTYNQEGSGSSASGGGSGAQTSGLSATGENTKLFALIAAVLMTISSALMVAVGSRKNANRSIMQ
jgi:hypothetical protein